MSAFGLIMSASHPASDVMGDPGFRLLLTRSGPPLHRGTSQKDFVEAKEAAPVA
jgi:hypothetical protein